MTQKIIRFPPKITSGTPEVFANSRRNVFFDLVNYVIDSKFRKSVKLISWIRTHVNESLKDDFFMETIKKEVKTGVSDDVTMLNCLKWVCDKVQYIGDYKQWSMQERWQTPLETFYNKKGDCEDGSILLYAIARAKGVIADKMFLWCGEVRSTPVAPLGGHCSFLYKPLEYPLNFVWLDWCYYPNLQPVFNRKIVFLNGKLVEEFSKSIEHGWMVKSSVYQKTWFLFNESFSTNNYLLKIAK